MRRTAEASEQQGQRRDCPGAAGGGNCDPRAWRQAGGTLSPRPLGTPRLCQAGAEDKPSQEVGLKPRDWEEQSATVLGGTPWLSQAPGTQEGRCGVVLSRALRRRRCPFSPWPLARPNLLCSPAPAASHTCCLQRPPGGFLRRERCLEEVRGSQASERGQRRDNFILLKNETCLFLHLEIILYPTRIMTRCVCVQLYKLATKDHIICSKQTLEKKKKHYPSKC